MNTDQSMAHTTRERIQLFIDLLNNPENADRYLCDILEEARSDIEPWYPSCRYDPWYFGYVLMKAKDIFRQYGGLVWEFPHGINQHKFATFHKQYTGETKLLDTLTPPDEFIVIWLYDVANMRWLWWRPGWPEATLETLENGKIYEIYVTDACRWEL